MDLLRFELQLTITQSNPYSSKEFSDGKCTRVVRPIRKLQLRTNEQQCRFRVIVVDSLFISLIINTTKIYLKINRSEQVNFLIICIFSRVIYEKGICPWD